MPTVVIKSAIASINTSRYYCRELNAQSKTLVMRGATWASGNASMEVVKRAILTPKYSYAGDQNYGLDYGKIGKIVRNYAAIFSAEIHSCLKFAVDAGLISDVQANAEVSQRNVVFDITFVDMLSAFASLATNRIVGEIRI